MSLTTTESTNATTGQAVMYGLRNGTQGINGQLGLIGRWKDITTAFGLHLVAYEGGPGLLQYDNPQAKYDASLSIEMKTLIEDYLSGWWKRGGELFEYFNVGVSMPDPTYVNSLWSVTSALDVTSNKLLAFKNAATFVEPSSQDIVANNTIPGIVAGADTKVFIDKNPTNDPNNGRFRWGAGTKNYFYNAETVGVEHWIDFVVYIREAGNYSMTPYVMSSVSTNLVVSIDGLVLSAVKVPKVNYPASATGVAIVPVVVAVPSAGWHTLRISSTPATLTEAGGQIGFNKFEFVKQ
jgi:hypothetical protein